MSTDEQRSTKREILIPDYNDGTHIATEYGCRYPDGTIRWRSWTDTGNIDWSYACIIPGSDVPFSADVARRWAKTLARRAEAANIQTSDYIEDHTFLKRTVILVTTAPEEV